MTKADGQEREMTKIAGVLSFSENRSDDDEVSPKSHMTNYIDSSGYVGFSSEVAVDLRITDGENDHRRQHRELHQAERDHASPRDDDSLCVQGRLLYS